MCRAADAKGVEYVYATVKDAGRPAAEVGGFLRSSLDLLACGRATSSDLPILYLAQLQLRVLVPPHTLCVFMHPITHIHPSPGGISLHCLSLNLSRLSVYLLTTTVPKFPCSTCICFHMPGPSRRAARPPLLPLLQAIHAVAG